MLLNNYENEQVERIINEVYLSPEDLELISDYKLYTNDFINDILILHNLYNEINSTPIFMYKTANELSRIYNKGIEEIQEPAYNLCIKMRYLGNLIKERYVIHKLDRCISRKITNNEDLVISNIIKRDALSIIEYICGTRYFYDSTYINMDNIPKQFYSNKTYDILEDHINYQYRYYLKNKGNTDYINNLYEVSYNILRKSVNDDYDNFKQDKKTYKKDVKRLYKQYKIKQYNEYIDSTNIDLESISNTKYEKNNI